MNPLDVSVIVPTYREAENLPVLVPRIATALQEAQLTFEIVIVDDNSPDATPRVCADLAARFPVRLETRTTERGLSSAVMHGMNVARGDVLVCMDADLSHPPEKVPELVRTLNEGADFVLGSRYVKGGATAEGWGLFRWLNSKVATLMAWPLTATSDPMAGFFAIGRDTFEAARNLDPIGYKIALELLVKCRCRDVREVPIHFENRLHGASKLSFQEQVNYLRHLKRLYEFKFGALARLAQFLLIGGTGMVVDLAFYVLLLGWLPLGLARAAAIWVAMTWNYWLNRRITFSFARRRAVLPQYAMFCLSCGLGAAVNWSVSLALSSLLTVFGGRPLLAAVVGIIAGSLFNFILCNTAVFHRTKPAPESVGEPVLVDNP
ncbi:MAG: glycosyltransferase family 2 protein [Gemmataceae bacterium]|nr:glycosyltransferase family 2 protein [Gemmataceae bacterium]